MNPQLDRTLDYQAPKPVAHRRLKPFLFACGAAVGAVAALLMLAVIRKGGPAFPATILFAPIWVVLEIIGSDASLYVGLLAGGPMLYGLYTLLWALPRRTQAPGSRRCRSRGVLCRDAVATRCAVGLGNGGGCGDGGGLGGAVRGSTAAAQRGGDRVRKRAVLPLFSPHLGAIGARLDVVDGRCG